MKKEKICSILGIIACLAAAWMKWDSEAEKRAGNAFFDAPAAEILSIHREEGYGGSSVLEYGSDGTAKYRVKELCGNDSILHLTAASDTALDITGKVRNGAARVMLEKNGNQEVLEVSLEDGAQEIALPKGEYTLFLTGQDFSGNFALRGEDICVEGMEE